MVAQLRVYAYDAYLLVCAMQMRTPLLSLDEPLRAAASNLRIDVLEVQGMKVYTFSEARQKFASVLDSAQKDGAVRVRRRDGRVFAIQPVKDSPSPLAVKGVRLKLRREEIVSEVREGRERA